MRLLFVFSVITLISSTFALARLPGHPIQLLTADIVDGAIALGLADEGIRMLHELPSTQPIAVLAVIGRNSRGKSFFLNQLLDRIPGDSMFEVSQQITSTTRGVMTWSQPPCVHDGRLVQPSHCQATDTRLVVLDTQGLNAHDFMSVALDRSLFSLVMMSTSVLFYNMDRKIDADNLAELSDVVSIAELLDSGKDKETFTLPNIIWTIQGTFDNNRGDQTSFIRQLLNDAAGNDRSVFNRRTAEMLLRFPSHHSYGLPPPVDSARLWPRLPELPPGDLDPEYREGIATLRKWAVDAATTGYKDVNHMNGQSLLRFLTVLTDVLVRSPVPEPGMLGDALGRAAVEDLTKLYESEVEAEVGACREAMVQLLRAGKVSLDTTCRPLSDTELEHVLRAHETGLSSSLRDYAPAEVLNERIREIKLRIIADNRSLSEHLCDQARQSAVVLLDDYRHAGEDDFALFIATVQDLESEFDLRCTGPAQPAAKRRLNRTIADVERGLVERFSGHAATLVGATSAVLLLLYRLVGSHWTVNTLVRVMADSLAVLGIGSALLALVFALQRFGIVGPRFARLCVRAAAQPQVLTLVLAGVFVLVVCAVSVLGGRGRDQNGKNNRGMKHGPTRSVNNPRSFSSDCSVSMSDRTSRIEGSTIM